MEGERVVSLRSLCPPTRAARIRSGMEGDRVVSLRSLLLPEPPRRIPGRRAISIALRSGHLIALAGLLGGHVFAVAEDRLVPWLTATVLTGVAMMALELTGTLAWFTTGQGVSVLAKLAVLATVPVFWDQRVPILVGTVALASITSHMPARYRHRQLFRFARPSYIQPPAGGGAP